MYQKKCAVVNSELCVACGSCQKVCPMGAIRVYKGLYAITDGARCIGCGRCAKEQLVSHLGLTENAQQPVAQN